MTGFAVPTRRSTPDSTPCARRTIIHRPKLTLDPFERRYARMWVGVRRTLINFRSGECVRWPRDFSPSPTSRGMGSRRREIRRGPSTGSTWWSRRMGCCRLEVEGNGFLYRMVRNMVGAALLEGDGGEGGGGEVVGGGIVAPRRWEHRRTDCFCTRWCIQRHSGRRETAGGR